MSLSSFLLSLSLIQKLLRLSVSHFSHLEMKIMEIVITYKDAHFSHFNVSIGEMFLAAGRIS